MNRESKYYCKWADTGLALHNRGGALLCCQSRTYLQDENQQPHTSHTTNPVPFIIINKEFENSNKIRLKNGGLQDVAPTIIELMSIKQPTEMTGSGLILKN